MNKTIQKELSAVVLVLATHGVLLAQTTYKGLRFGMSETEIRKAYSGNLRKETGDTHEEVLADDSVELLGAALSVRAKVEFSLGKVGKLDVINIIAKDPFGSDKDQVSASGSSLAAVDELMSRLADRYGSPTTEEGKCKPTAEMLLSKQPVLCDRMWRAEGQNIKMFWSIFDGRLRDFVLSYKPLPQDF